MQLRISGSQHRIRPYSNNASLCVTFGPAFPSIIGVLFYSTMSPRWERTNKLSGDDLLIAVCLERFGDHPLLAPPYGLCKQAIIRGVSTESRASFKFETCPLPPAHMERFEKLREHGFTSMLAPSNWCYKYPPHTWHDELIVEAVSKVEKFPRGEPPSRLAGYDHELAQAVMEAVNDVFPHSLALIDLKYQFHTEPSDVVLSNVLNALRGDRYIDGANDSHGKPELNPLEQVTLTTEGRRHLDKKMKKRSRPQRPYSGNEATEFILQQLLSEFRERQLTTTDLRQSYKGLSPSELKNRSLAAGISEVDFDLAMSELDKHGLVKTGPMAMRDNPPGSLVTVIGLYSKGEYSYITENGYKEASKTKSIPVRSVQTIIQGDQYNIRQAGAVGAHSTGIINNQPQWTAIQNQADLGALTSELEKLRLHLAQSASTGRDYAQLQLVAEAKDAAAKQDGNKVVEFLTKGGKALLDAATDFGAKLTAELIAKQSGLS